MLSKIRLLIYCRDRMITVAQRLNTETDRKGKKSYGRPMNYFGYSDLDPLDFPEYSTRKFSTIKKHAALSYNVFFL